jgi:hypothetical protein
MAQLNPRNMPYIRSLDPKLHEALADIVNAHNNIAQQVNADPTSVTPPPPKIAGLNVVEQNGIFDAQITDHSAFNRGSSYMLEYSDTPNFQNAHTVHLGPARNWRGNLGAGSLHFRAYSAYGSSAPSEPVYHGGRPGIVVGSGSMVGPPMQQGMGSGTGSATQTAQGFGSLPYRSSTGKAPTRG